MKLYIAIGGALLVLLVVACVVPVILASGPPAQPTQWQEVETATKQLTLEVPANWRFSTAGSESLSEWARVQGGKLSRVTIHGSHITGAMGDITSSFERMGSGMMDMAGAEGVYREPDVSESGEGQLHALLGRVAAKEDKHFQDLGKMEACEFGGRQAARSDYTTRRRVGFLTVNVRGRRITAPAGDLAYDVRAECPEKHWDNFEPIADRILKSVDSQR
ncbi:MAG: hypothetical protein ACE5JM_15335 [Armatimonadota bacterium]